LSKSFNRSFYEDSDIQAEINVQLDILENVLDKGAIKTRINKFRLKKHMEGDTLQKAYAVNMIASDGMSKLVMPDENNLTDMVDDTNKWISEIIARNYIQRKVEEEVEKELMDKQDKYIDEMRLHVLRKKKGPENAKTTKKYEDLVALDEKHMAKNIQPLLRPESFEEIVGQERAIKSLLSKISSP